MQNGTLLAAVDLGSNSFRLEMGRFDHGRIHRTEYHKETVRQAVPAALHRVQCQVAVGIEPVALANRLLVYSVR